MLPPLDYFFAVLTHRLRELGEELYRPLAIEHRRIYFPWQFCFTKAARVTLFEWLMHVTEDLKYEAIVYQSAVSYVDGFLSQTYSTSPDRFQLIGITALFMAIKMHAKKVRGMNSKKASSLTNGSCQPQHISRMEANIGLVLKWQLRAATPAHYLYYFTDLLSLLLYVRTRCDVNRFRTLISKYRPDFNTKFPLLRMTRSVNTRYHSTIEKITDDLLNKVTSKFPPIFVDFPQPNGPFHSLFKQPPYPVTPGFRETVSAQCELFKEPEFLSQAFKDFADSFDELEDGLTTQNIEMSIDDFFPSSIFSWMLDLSNRASLDFRFVTFEAREIAATLIYLTFGRHFGRK